MLFSNETKVQGFFDSVLTFSLQIHFVLWRCMSAKMMLYYSGESNMSPILTGCVVVGHSLARARAAMPFGCLTLGEKKDYNNPSEVTDKYDLGQIVKS